MAFQIQRLVEQPGAVNYGSDEPDSLGYSDNNWWNVGGELTSREVAERKVESLNIWPNMTLRIREIA